MGSLSVIIIGHNQLNNELLGKFISPMLDCRISYDQDLFSASVYQDGSTLLIYDCQSKTAATLMKDLLFFKAIKKEHMFLCLINLKQNYGIELTALKCGIKGFFYVGDSAESIERGIKSIMYGGTWLSEMSLNGDQMEKQTRNQTRWRLTPREVEILPLVSMGLRNEQIAERLFISPHTVRTHLHKIFKKINVANRAQAAHWVTSNLPPPEFDQPQVQQKLQQ